MEKELEKYRASRAEKYREARKSWWKPSFSLEGTRFRNFTTWFPLNSDQHNEEVFSWFILFLKFLFWVLLWGFFIQIEFGTVFFIVSMFYWVYASMQAGTRKAWEPSAYSVFNENCEAIANGCLLPLCAVDGMAVTTVEGIGSTKTALHPVQVMYVICDIKCDVI